MKRNCDECQEEYEAVPAYLNRGQGIFCSRRCSSLYHGRQRAVKHEPNTMCAWCGIDFYRKPSSKKNSKSGLFFCSKEHQSNAFADDSHPVNSGPKRSESSKSMRNLTCSVCGETFHVKTRSKTGMHQSCKVRHDRQVLIDVWLSGDNSVTLNRSRSTGQPVDTKRFVKQYLIETRGDKCEECGWDQKAPDGRSIIQMDHINGNCFDNRPENLKLLCPNHHAMTPNYGSLNKGSGRAHRRK